VYGLNGGALFVFHPLNALRHACASLWIEQAHNPKSIQTLMGHPWFAGSNPAGAKLGTSCVETVCRARSLVTQPLDRTNLWSLR
jgi:hypothetical protein